MLSSINTGVLTQHQAGEISFIHIIENVLQYSLEHPISLALLQYMSDKPDTRYVLTMFDDDIDDLTYIIKPNKEEEEEENEEELYVKINTIRTLIVD